MGNQGASADSPLTDRGCHDLNMAPGGRGKERGNRLPGLTS